MAKRLCLVDDLKMLKITMSNTSSRNKLNPEVNDHYNIFSRESQEYELKTKDEAYFPRGTSCGRDGLHAQHLINCLNGSVVAVSDELVSSITQVVSLFLDMSCPKMLGKYIDSAPLTPLIKPGGGIRPIVVGTVGRRLVSKVSALMIGHSLDGYLDDLNFGVGVSGEIARLCYEKFVFVVLLYRVGWNSVTPTQLDCITVSTPYGHAKGCSRAWYLDDGTIVRDTLVVGEVLELIMEDGPRMDLDFCSQLVMKRVAKTIMLMDAVAKINDPQCEFLLLLVRRIVTASGPGFDNWQWRLATLPFAFGGLGVYSTGDVLNYAFLALRLQSADLQTKLLRHTGIVASGPNFDDVLFVFNTSMETDFLSNPSEIAAPKLMKKMADISRRENHPSDWLRTVPISGLGQTMNACSKVFNGDIYGDHIVSCAGIIDIKHRHNVVRDTLVDICYRSGISADLTGSSPLTQTKMIDFVPGRTVIDVAQRKRADKEVDIGLDGGRDKPLRPADMLLYSWDG
ncbi:hypothetical protein Tco_1563973 [Tanacetum coccineum]